MLTMRSAVLLLVATACTEGNLQVVNTQPNATIESPNSDDSTLFEGIPQTFRGRAQDSDNRPEDLVASWWIGQEAVCAEAAPTSAGETFCEITLADGPTEIRLQVTDRGGLTGVDTQVFWARPSAEPVAQITSLDPSGQYFADRTISFEGNVEDVEDESSDLTAWWESNLDGVLGEVEATPSTTGRVSGIGFLSEGDHQIRLYVEDRAGNVTYDTEVIRVGPANRAPQCLGITYPEDGAIIRSGMPVTFTADVTDPDVPGNFLTVTWESDKMGEIGTSTPTSAGAVVFPFSGLTPEPHIIQMEATDAFGQTCTALIQITVDSPPLVQLHSPTPNTVFAIGEPIQFSATVSDAETAATDLRINWTDSVYGFMGAQGPTDSSGAIGFPFPGFSPGPHLVTLTVTDNADLTTQIQVPFSVNAIPTTPVVELQPAQPNTEDDITAVLALPSTDPDGDALTYSYRWFRNSQHEAGQTGPTIESRFTQRGDVWRVEVRASDANASGAPGASSATIVNSVPAVDSATISGAPFFESSVMTCVPGTSSDADGDSVSYTFGWSVQGVEQAVSTPTLDGSFFDRGDEVTCTATPTDGRGAGASVVSPPVNVLNTPPGVSNVAISPSAPEAVDTLICNFDYADDDADPELSMIEWRRAGTLIGTGRTYSGSMEPGEAISCTVTANDGLADGNTQSATVTVATSAPTIDDVTISPDAPTRTQSLTCDYAGFSDPQGDADQSTRQWTVNGADAGTGRTLTSPIVKGDVVACTVTPSDGLNTGVPSTDTVTVRNSLPTVPTVECGPAFPLSSLDDIVCRIRTRSTDADGDSISYQFAWTIDGTDYFGADDGAEESTMSRLDYAGLETVQVTVTPNDGEDNGPVATASLNTLPSIEPKLGLGASHSCALNRRGEVTCWGSGLDNRTSPPPDIFLDLDGALTYTCGLVEDGSLECWGLLQAPADGSSLRPPSNGPYTAISAGESAACAVPTSGGVECWGSNFAQQISGAPSSGSFTDVAVGDRFACALRSSGTVVCWGDAGAAVLTPPPGTYSQIAAGAFHSCGVLTSGALACWGSNGDNRSTPPSGTDFFRAGAGLRHSCAVKTDGEIVCWGFNADGRATPQVNDANGDPISYNAVDIWIHTCATDELGRAFCWGRDEEGQSSPP